jgi:hypothetical protein
MITYNTHLKLKKHCTFNDGINMTYETYSSDEYDRHCIDSILYQKLYNRISDYEWLLLLSELNTYKKKEMIIHLSNMNVGSYALKTESVFKPLELKRFPRNN